VNKKSDIEALRELTSDPKNQSKMGRLRGLFDEIERAKAAGIKNSKILATLNAQGLDLNLNTFETMLYSIRKERKRKPNQNTAATPLDNTPEKEFHNPNKNTEKIAEITKDNDIDNEDLSGLTDKQRRERIADKYMNIGTKNPILQKILDKKKE
jgi:hypothetical protein